MVVAILQSLFDKKGTTFALLRLIGGLFLCFTVISPVITMGFDTLLEKVENIFGALRGTPTAGEWLVRFCEENGWNFRSERSFYILEFGFNSAVAYLEQTGRVRSRRVNGNLRFARKAADRRAGKSPGEN